MERGPKREDIGDVRGVAKALGCLTGKRSKRKTWGSYPEVQ